MPERNSKVRRRIAAGKFRLRIRDLRNLGPRAERWLADAGIHLMQGYFFARPAFKATAVVAPEVWRQD